MSKGLMALNGGEFRSFGFFKHTWGPPRIRGVRGVAEK